MLGMIQRMNQPLPYLNELDQLLLDQSDDFMLLSQLDGFLTGIIVSPDLVTPATWLRQIWVGDDGNGVPGFEDAAAFQHFIDLVMRHYNAIIASLRHSGKYEAVLDVDTRNGDVLWEIWIEGFSQAMAMAPDGWTRLVAADDAPCSAAIAGMGTLRALSDGELACSRAEKDRWNAEAADLIPIWVQSLHRWRLENDPELPTTRKRDKVGRNDPCPCGSGYKYKKCCGLN